MENVNIIEKNDHSVEKLLSKTAKSLKQKYERRRIVNERLLRKKTPLQRTFMIIGDVLCALMVIVAGVVCLSGLNSRIQKVCPTFAGYTTMVVKTGSMVASGFNVGDPLVVKSVDTHTLHEHDMIAFYTYPEDYKSFDVDMCIRVKESDIPNTYFTTSFASIFGIQPKAIAKAAKSGAKLVFHHIREIYEDETGTRWFKTYGSSNKIDDSWYISENMVVGKYVDNSSSGTIAQIIQATNSRFGFLILLIPVAMLAAVIILESMKNVQLAKLELDCVEEKRKITDPICVKNNVGFNMDSKTKFKILAQADTSNYNEYISLLWRKGQTPENIRKYYIKKDILLGYNRKMVELNRECENMFKAGDKPAKIAKYYHEQKAFYEAEQQKRAKELRSY